MGNANMNTTKASAGLAARAADAMAKATPGPWVVYGKQTIRNKSDVLMVAKTHWDNGKANAALIAMAPDLAAEVIRLTQINAELTATHAALMRRVEMAREALQSISDGQIPDQPATSAVSEVIYIRRHVAYLRNAARAWLAGGAE